MEMESGISIILPINWLNNGEFSSSWIIFDDRNDIKVGISFNVDGDNRKSAAWSTNGVRTWITGLSDRDLKNDIKFFNDGRPSSLSWVDIIQIVPNEYGLRVNFEVKNGSTKGNNSSKSSLFKHDVVASRNVKTYGFVGIGWSNSGNSLTINEENFAE